MSNTLAYILILNYVWHIQNYRLKCSMRGQFGGYFTFPLWLRSCDSQVSSMSRSTELYIFHGGDTSWPKTVQNGGPHAISEILHIEYRIDCCIETYLIHIYHMSTCSKCKWNRYIEGFCMWNVHFHINGLSPNITYINLMSWPLMAIYFLLLNYWLFSVQFSYRI